MDLLQLEHFLAVVDERTFTRAAERVCRTQSAVSQSIKKLEEEIGAPLFARDVHEVSLTEAGRVLADHARRMVHLRDEAIRQVTELKTLKSGTLAIAAHESAAVYLLPAPLRMYLQRFPDVKIKIYRSRLHEIPRQVMDREVDVGFVKDQPAFHELEWMDVHDDELLCIASPRHPLAGRADVRVSDLGSEQFVLHHLCNSTAEAVQSLFERHATRLPDRRGAMELREHQELRAGGRRTRVRSRHHGAARAARRHAGPPAAARAGDPAAHPDDLPGSGLRPDTARELIKIVRAFNWDQESNDRDAVRRTIAVAAGRVRRIEGGPTGGGHH